MKKVLSIVVITFLFSSTVYAQFGFGKLEDILEMKEKTLLIVLKSEIPKTAKKLKDNLEKLNEYKNSIKLYNEHIMNAFDSEWKLSNEVKYITWKQLNEIEKNDSQKDKFAYFKNFTRSANHFSFMGSIPENTFEIGLTNKNKAVYSILYASENMMNEADAIFIVQQIQNYLNGRIELKSGKKSKKELKKEFKERANKLKNKILLLDIKLITSNLKKKIKTIYPYKYEIVNKKVIDKAIIEKSENIAYIRPIPVAQITNKNGIEKVSKQLYLQYIINAFDGELLTYIAPGFSIGMSGDGNGQTSLNDIKKIAKRIK